MEPGVNTERPLPQNSCLSSRSMSSPKTVKIGIPISLSGQFQVQGRQALAGLMAWADDVNRAGGLSFGGQVRPVSVIHHDDGSDRGTVQTITRRLIRQDRVDILIGPYSSVLAVAAAEVAENQGRLLWNQGGASANLYRRGYRWVVGILTPAEEYLTGLFEMVRRSAHDTGPLGLVRATPGAFPREVGAGVLRSAQASGVPVVLDRQYPAATSDFSGLIREIQDAGAEVLVAVGRVQDDLALAWQLAQSDLRLAATAVVAAGVGQFQDSLGPLAEGFLGPSQWEPEATHPVDYGPSVAEVTASLRRAGYAAVDYPMAQAYAAGVAVQRCLEESGTVEDEALRSAAAGLDFSTFFGRFKIDPDTGRPTGRRTLLVQWQQDRKVIVWPPETARGTFRYPWR